MKDNSIIGKERIWERPVSSKPKMPRAQRAKQFAPFDALTGLSERLRRAEEEHERQMEMTGVHRSAEIENITEE